MYVNTGKQTNLIDSNKKGKSHIYFMYKWILQHIHYTYVISTYIAMYVHTHITENLHFLAVDFLYPFSQHLICVLSVLSIPAPFCSYPISTYLL